MGTVAVARRPLRRGKPAPAGFFFGRTGPFRDERRVCASGNIRAPRLARPGLTCDISSHAAQPRSMVAEVRTDATAPPLRGRGGIPRPRPRGMRCRHTRNGPILRRCRRACGSWSICATWPSRARRSRWPWPSRWACRSRVAPDGDRHRRARRAEPASSARLRRGHRSRIALSPPSSRSTSRRSPALLLFAGGMANPFASPLSAARRPDRDAAAVANRARRHGARHGELRAGRSLCRTVAPRGRPAAVRGRRWRSGCGPASR